MTRKKSKNKKVTTSLADQADKFRCYQKSVQCPEHELDFFLQAYKDLNGGQPKSFREDFCGTFTMSCHWVKSDKQRTAVAVDLCQETLDWGREHNLAKLLPEQQQRIRILNQDVRKRNRPAVDILAAQNFSFWTFKTREEVVEYFVAAKGNLARNGIMILDMMGGGDCYNEGHVDNRVVGKGKKKFTYYWKQASFNPFNNHAQFSISFSFKDGSKLKDAFVYDWRFWSIPEVREMLQEAGFSDSQVYFEKEPSDEDSDAAADEVEWECRTEAPSHPVWLAYIVAVR